MSVYTVTFTTKDSADNLLGCATLLDEFATGEFAYGTLAGVSASGNSLHLSPSGLGTEDRCTSATSVSSTTKTWVEQELVALQTCFIGQVTYQVRLAGTYTASLRTDAGLEIGTGSAEATSVGEWLTIALDVPVLLREGETYRLHMVTPSAKIYYGSTPHEGSLWRAVKYIGSGFSDQVSGPFGLIPCTFSGSGQRVSKPADLAGYSTPPPDLKIIWNALVPEGTSLLIETGCSDSDTVPPTEWYPQTSGTSLTNLPADLTGKYLFYRATLETTASLNSPVLRWLVVYDAVNSSPAAARVSFSGQLLKANAAGQTVFSEIAPGTDLPYVAYVLAVASDQYTYREELGTVTVGDADVAQDILVQIVTSRVTQQYLEAAVLPEAWNAVVTQQYLEAACVVGGWMHTLNTVNGTLIGTVCGVPILQLKAVDQVE